VLGALLLVILANANSAYRSALARVPLHRWWFAGGEVVFYLVCMIGYRALWEKARGQRWWHRLLAIFASTNLLYHFPPLFTMISLLSTRGELADATLDRSQYLRFIGEGELVARVVHHWLASLTTAGIAVLLLAARPRRAAVETPNSARASVLGARVALAATLLQLPIGLWVLLGLPPSAQARVLGDELLTTVLFSAAIFSTVLFVMQLLAAALGDTRRRTAFLCGVLLLIVLLLMSSVLHRVRDGAAAPVGAAWAIEVAHD
jgi:hypothetical protein